MPEELFSDGGLMGAYPSKAGAMWAWCLVENDERIVQQASGFFLPEEIEVEKLHSNLSELVGLLNGLEALPSGWKGRVNGDNWNALNWTFQKADLSAVPLCLETRILAFRDRWGIEPEDAESVEASGLSFRLLGGHPTEEDLARGIRAARPGKSCLPCSRWNVHCDRECNLVKADRTGVPLKEPKPKAGGNAKEMNPPRLSPLESVPRDLEALAEEERFQQWVAAKGWVTDSLLTLGTYREIFEREVAA